MDLDLAEHAGLVRAPLVGLALVHLYADPTVEPVVVGGVQPALKVLVLLAELVEGLGVLALHVGVAGAQGVADQGEGVLVELKRRQGARDAGVEQALGHVLDLLAQPTALAAVVDVLLLLDLADEESPLLAAFDTGAAEHEAGEGEVVLLVLGGVAAPVLQALLYAVPELAGDERLMDALVDAALVDEVTGVDQGREDLVNL